MQPVELQGVIKRFKGDGRKLGYPTANIVSLTDLADGVYFGFANLKEWYDHPAIIFIGVPTTLGETERRVETYLIDIPDEDYYGQSITLRLEYFHRSNQTFDNIEQLQLAMKQDENAARRWFAGKT